MTVTKTIHMKVFWSTSFIAKVSVCLKCSVYCLTKSKICFPTAQSGGLHLTIYVISENRQSKCACVKVGRVWTSLGALFFIFHTTTTITFRVNNQVQHHECLQGETVWKCKPLLPFAQFITPGLLQHCTLFGLPLSVVIQNTTAPPCLFEAYWSLHTLSS